MNFSFAPVWSWPFVLFCCAVVAGVVAIGYPRQVKHLNLGRQRLLLGIRSTLVLLLLFLMLRPSIVLESEDRSDSIIYVLHDVSPSMQTPDAPGGVSRAAAQKEMLSTADEFLSELNDSVRIQRRSFSESLLAHTPEGPEPQGKFTSLSNTLEQLLEEVGSERLAMVILSSDGRQAAYGHANRNPIPLARILGKRHSPIYTVVSGTSDVISTGLDVAVSELDIARDVFVRNVVPVQVRLHALGAAGRRLRLRILLEQPGLPAENAMTPVPVDQQNQSAREIEIETDSFEKLINLQFVPQIFGEFKVAVEAVPLDGEVRPTNNRIETIIRVRKGGIRVVYFDVLRPEQKWVNRITESSRVQLDFQPVLSGEFRSRNRFDESWFIPGNVDAFIIGDVPADVLGRERLEQIYRCCRQGAGLMMTGGENNYGAGGYQAHRIAELLPVDVQATVEQLTGAVRMRPTDAGLRHSVMQIARPEVNQERWEELPPLAGGNLLREQKGLLAEVLATTESNTPLLIGHEVGNTRVLAFAGDTTWHWHVFADEQPGSDAWKSEAFQRFWRQVIFWLTKQEHDSDAPVWITAEPRDLIPGQAADLTFGARDAQHQPVPDAEFALTVTKPDGTTIQLPTARDIGQNSAIFSQADQPGDYLVRLDASLDGISLGQARTRFLVNARDPELDSPSADPEMMRELAHVSGGDFLSVAELLKRLEHWADEGLPGQHLRRTKQLSLWDNWFVLLAFTGLMTFEWALRKKSGLV